MSQILKSRHRRWRGSSTDGWLWPPSRWRRRPTVAEVVILLTGVISRFGFDRPLVWSDELATITFLWLGMFGAAIALRRGQHMRHDSLAGPLRWRYAWRSSRRSAASARRVVSRNCAFGGRSSLHKTSRYVAYSCARAERRLSCVRAARRRRTDAGGEPDPMFATYSPREIALAVGVLAVIALALYLAAPASSRSVTGICVSSSCCCCGCGVLIGVPIAFAFGIATVAYLLTHRRARRCRSCPDAWTRA